MLTECIREVQLPAPPALIVDKPLRSGQQVYARGGDLVVLARSPDVPENGLAFRREFDRHPFPEPFDAPGWDERYLHAVDDRIGHGVIPA